MRWKVGTEGFPTQVSSSQTENENYYGRTLIGLPPKQYNNINLKRIGPGGRLRAPRGRLYLKNAFGGKKNKNNLKAHDSCFVLWLPGPSLVV